MARGAFTFRILPGSEEEYDRRHRAVWPRMMTAIKAAGYRNYSLYRDGTTVFGYFEADDIGATLRRISLDPVARQWEDFMGDIIDRALQADGVPTTLPEVFRLD